MHRTCFTKFYRRDESGQTMAEYGIALGVISVGVVLVMGLLSNAISTGIDEVASLIP
jgi:Flp pilus assembly pilin Flp